MDGKQLMESLNEIDPDMVQDAETAFVKTERGRDMRIITSAVSAAAVILIAASLIVSNFMGKGGGQPGRTIAVSETVTAEVSQGDTAGEETAETAEEEMTENGMSDLDPNESAASTEPAVSTRGSDVSLQEEHLPILAAKERFTMRVSYEQDETLLAFCKEKGISDPDTVCRLVPECFGEADAPDLFVTDDGIWGMYGGRVSGTPLGTDTLSSAALADFDGNGIYEMYYVIGAGANTSGIMVYYPERPTVLQGPVYYESNALAASVESMKNGCVIRAEDRIRMMLEPWETVMLSTDAGGELCAYRGEISEGEAGGYNVVKKELLADRFGETLIREGMRWCKYDRQTTLLQELFAADADLSVTGLFENMQMGMSPDEVQARMNYEPASVIMDDEDTVFNFGPFDNSVGENGEVRDFTWEKSFRFSPDGGLYEVRILSDNLFINTDRITVPVRSMTGSSRLYQNTVPMAREDAILTGGEFAEGVCADWTGTADESGMLSVSRCQEDSSAEQGGESGDDRFLRMELVLDAEEAQGKDILTFRVLPGKESLCRRALEKKEEIIGEEMSAMWESLSSGELPFMVCYPEIARKQEDAGAVRRGFVIRPEDGPVLMEKLTAAMNSLQADPVCDSKNTLTGINDLVLAWDVFDSAGLLQLETRGKGRAYLMFFPNGSIDVYLETCDENRNVLQAKGCIMDREAALELEKLLEEIGTRTPFDRMKKVGWNNMSDPTAYEIPKEVE